MADVYKNISGAITTSNVVIFTVPEANVAASPPTPVTTFVLKSLWVSHHTTNTNKVLVTAFHVDSSQSNVAIPFFQEVQEKEQFNIFKDGIYIFEAGDQLKIQANLAPEAFFSANFLEIKAQQ